MHGFKGPIIFTTDRCCDEREFYEGKRNEKKRPIFDSFAPIHSFVPESKEEIEEAISHENDNESSTEAGGEVPKGYKIVTYLDVPSKPITFSTRVIADATANDIVSKCDENNWNVVSIDSEWTLGHKEEPDIIQVTTRDLETYIFEKPFPNGLKTLLESTTILKVASKISSDRSKLAKAGITLRNYESLQNMAKARGVVPMATVGLSHLCNTLFGYGIQKDNKLRLSNWRSPSKSDEQIRYAAIDACAQMMCYLKMEAMPYVNAGITPPPSIDDLNKGDQVLLYTPNKSVVVAVATYISRQEVETPFGIKKEKDYVVVSLIEAKRPSALVPKMNDKTLQELQESGNGNSIIWSVKHLRKLSAGPTPTVDFAIHTQKVLEPDLGDANDEPIPPPAEPPADIMNCNGDCDGDCDCCDGDCCDCCGDEQDMPPACRKRCGKSEEPENNEQDTPPVSYPLHEETHTKQDIEHIFIRFGRVLSKSHGARHPPGYGTAVHNAITNVVHEVNHVSIYEGETPSITTKISICHLRERICIT